MELFQKILASQKAMLRCCRRKLHISALPCFAHGAKQKRNQVFTNNSHQRRQFWNHVPPHLRGPGVAFPGILREVWKGYWNWNYTLQKKGRDEPECPPVKEIIVCTYWNPDKARDQDTAKQNQDSGIMLMTGACVHVQCRRKSG